MRTRNQGDLHVQTFQPLSKKARGHQGGRPAGDEPRDERDVERIAPANTPSSVERRAATFSQNTRLAARQQESLVYKREHNVGTRTQPQEDRIVVKYLPRRRVMPAVMPVVKSAYLLTLEQQDWLRQLVRTKANTKSGSLFTPGLLARLNTEFGLSLKECHLHEVSEQV